MPAQADPAAGAAPPSAPDDEVVTLRAALDAALQRLDAVERRLGDSPETRLDAVPVSVPAPVPPADAPGGRVAKAPVVARRRALLGLAGVAAAGAVAAASPAQPAAAANGNALTIGSSSNTGTLPTGLAVTGTAAAYGIGVTDNGLNTLSDRPAVFGHARGVSFKVGAFGLAEGDTTTGVQGTGLRGAAGVTGRSDTGIGGVFSTNSTTGGLGSAITASTPTGGTALRLSASTHIHFGPHPGYPPSTSTQDGWAGQLRWVDEGGGRSHLWACTVSGTPGTWRRIVGRDSAGAFHLLPVPVRVYDSRPGTSPSQGPKTPLPAGNVARTIDLKVNGSPVPSGASGALLTVLLVNASTTPGNLTIWSASSQRPASNTMVWGGNAGRFTATAVSALDALARLQVAASQRTDLVLDVVGYYV